MNIANRRRATTTSNKMILPALVDLVTFLFIEKHESLKICSRRLIVRSSRCRFDVITLISIQYEIIKLGLIITGPPNVPGILFDQVPCITWNTSNTSQHRASSASSAHTEPKALRPSDNGVNQPKIYNSFCPFNSSWLSQAQARCTQLIIIGSYTPLTYLLSE